MRHLAHRHLLHFFCLAAAARQSRQRQTHTQEKRQTSVSYTQLDVYKRQPYHRECYAAEGRCVFSAKHVTSDINQVQSGINLFLRLFLRSPFVVFGAMIMAFTINFRSAMILSLIHIYGVRDDFRRTRSNQQFLRRLYFYKE